MVHETNLVQREDPMTAEQMRAEALKAQHPHLWKAVHHGTLPEASGEFVKVAEQFPLKTSSE